MNTLFKSSIVALTALFIASCATNNKIPESQKAAEKPKITNQINIERQWSVDLGSDYSVDSNGFQAKKESGIIYTANQSGAVKAINSSDGETIWKSKVAKLSAGVGIGSNTIYVASDEGAVIALDKFNGAELWTKTLSSEILVSPVEYGGTVISRSLDGVIYGLTSKDGSEIWSLSREFPSLTLRRDIEPLLIGKIAIFGLPSGQLVAIDALTGRVVWDIAVSVPDGNNPLQRMRDIPSKPVANKHLFFVNSFQGEVINIDMRKRSFVWKKAISSHKPLSLGDKNIFLTNEKSEVIAISQVNGTELWRNDKLINRGVSAPYVAGNYLLVFGQDSDLYILDKSNGDFLASHSFPGKTIIGNPIINNASGTGLSFSIVSNNGKLYSYSFAR